MRLAERLAALRAFCARSLPGGRKPDMLRPGMLGMRGSMANGLKTTAMHSMSPLSPPPLAEMALLKRGGGMLHQLWRRRLGRGHRLLLLRPTPTDRENKARVYSVGS